MSNPLNLDIIIPPQLRRDNHFQIKRKIFIISLFTMNIESATVKSVDSGGNIQLEEYPKTHFRIKDPCIITEAEYRTILWVDYFPHQLSYTKIKRQASEGDAPSISVFYYLEELKKKGGENWSVMKFLKEAKKH